MNLEIGAYLDSGGELQFSILVHDVLHRSNVAPDDSAHIPFATARNAISWIAIEEIRIPQANDFGVSDTALVMNIVPRSSCRGAVVRNTSVAFETISRAQRSNRNLLGKIGD